MEEKIKKINDALLRLNEASDIMIQARDNGWAAVAAVLADGPVEVILTEAQKERIHRELESVPEGLEREAMAAKGGPGYLDALAEESIEMEYGTERGPRRGLIVSLSIEDGLRAVVADAFSGDRTEVGIDDMHGALAPVLAFIAKFGGRSADKA